MKTKEIFRKTKDFVKGKAQKLDEKRRMAANERYSRLTREIRRADRFFDLKEYKEAGRIYKKYNSKISKKDEGTKKQVMYNLGLCYYYANEDGKAINIFRKLYRLYPNEHEAHFLEGLAHLGFCNFRKNWKEFAEKVNRDFLRAHPDADPKVLRKHANKFEGKQESRHEEHLEEAATIFRHATKADKRNPKYWYYFGLVCYYLNKREMAVDAFDVVLELDPNFNADIDDHKCELFNNMKEESSIQTGSFSRIEQFDKERCIKTERGVMVRSKAEALIDNFYFNTGIKARYEPTLVLDGKKVHPDWIIQTASGQIVHEHLGSPHSKELFLLKEPLYKKQGFIIITTGEKDEKDIENALKGKLMEYFDFTS